MCVDTQRDAAALLSSKRNHCSLGTEHDVTVPTITNADMFGLLCDRFMWRGLWSEIGQLSRNSRDIPFFGLDWFVPEEIPCPVYCLLLYSDTCKKDLGHF